MLRILDKNKLLEHLFERKNYLFTQFDKYCQSAANSMKLDNIAELQSGAAQLSRCIDEISALIDCIDDFEIIPCKLSDTDKQYLITQMNKLPKVQEDVTDE